mgnify:CR=1 FL=1
MVTYKSLRDKLQSLEKYEGCVSIARPPVINEGFPGQFNVSFAEHPWLVEHGKYMDFDNDYVFSTIPSCIRWNDIYDETTKTSKLDGSDSWKYLGVFEMADLIGMVGLSRRTNALDLQRRQANSLVKLLESLGITKDRIHPSYQVGGEVSEVTDGRYKFSYQIPTDSIGKQVLLEQGIPEENLIGDRTRDTLLALRLERQLPRGKVQIPTPWGYRNEINVNIGTKENPKYVDIGTLERFAWKPIYDKGRIIGLEEIRDEVSIGAVGLERLCMVANGLDAVQQIDCIKPFYEILPIDSKKVLVGESLRALHRIYSDMNKYEIGLSKRRKIKVKRMLRTVLDSEISMADVEKLLRINADNQSWHPELEEGVNFCLEETRNYSTRRNS